MKNIKKLWCVLLSVLLIAAALVPSFNAAAASDTVNVSVQGSYAQTDARTLLDKVNALRLGEDAWYYAADGATKTDVTGTLGELAYNSSLEKAAMQRAAELALNYSHTRPDGSSGAFAYGAFANVSENIASGYASADALFTAWLAADSYEQQGERRAMLSNYYTAFGAAHFTASGVDFWVMALGNGSGSGAPAAAKDGEASVSVSLSADSITSFIMAADAQSVNGFPSETVKLPRVTASIRTSAQKNGAGVVTAFVTPVWTVADTAIAVTNGLTLNLKMNGDTTMTGAVPAVAGANTVSVSISVRTAVPPKNGWVKENGKWYFYDHGVYRTGWQKIDGKWYLFKYADGSMITGWYKSGSTWYYLSASGAMVTGWQKISNKWYYFNSSGAMLTGWQKIGGKWYYFTANGDMKTGWLKDGGKWYYLESSGAMVAGKSMKIGSKTYNFNSSGVCTNP